MEGDDYARMLAYFDEAITNYPNVAAFHTNRGFALHSQSRSEEALAAINEAFRSIRSVLRLCGFEKNRLRNSLSFVCINGNREDHSS